MKEIYSENTMGRYVQAVIHSDDFLEQVEKWLNTIEDDRIQLLKRYVFELDLSETELLKDTLYEYGSHLTEGNYVGRKFFEQMAALMRQIELNRQSALM